MIVLYYTVAAYLPSRILLLHGNDPQYLSSMLSRAQVPVESVNISDASYVLPKLFVDGAPVYSHVVIFGEQCKLSKDDMDKLSRYIEGVDDPMYSRLSNYEKETLPDFSNYTNNITRHQFNMSFDPYPGASIMVVSGDEDLKPLISKLGSSVVEPPLNTEFIISQTPILRYKSQYESLLHAELASGMFVTPSYKNKRVPFQPIYSKGNSSLIAAWRGVRNNARVVFVGNHSLGEWVDTGNEQQKSLAVKILYDLIDWFIMNTQMARVTEFSHVVLDLPVSSQCRQNLHLSKATGDHVREGNLVLIQLGIEELNGGRWSTLAPLKRYGSFGDMVQQVGYPKLSNKNFQSFLRKQQKSFVQNYDACMREAIGGDFRYTELQVYESFVQDWYVMNLAFDEKTQKYYALLQPDLVRSYTVSVDFDRDYMNRITLVQRIHAYVDRFEEQRFFYGNSVWQVCLILVMVLSFVACLALLLDREEPRARAGKVNGKDD